MGATAPLPMKKCPKCGSEQPNDAAFCPDDGAPLEDLDLVPPPSDPYLGKVIAGDIEVRSVAGAGAMGRVYRAWQRGIERDVAVKILHRELGSNTSLVSRFHREAKIASRLQHPHVVEVYMAGQLPDGAMYIVMEYLDGMSLASALASAGGHFPLERAIPIALQICDAVGEGHARGIIHRDLKPENVMLVRRADTSDWVKVLDFGIARVNLGDQSMETAAGLIFGTARYISPEGAQGAPVGPPADVYSIATMIYQMFAGRTPFQADTAVALLVKQIHEEPLDIRANAPAATLPQPIVDVLMANLAKAPERRHTSARALGNAIAMAAKEANVSFSDVGVVARMSIVDPMSAHIGLDPTIDDMAQMPGVSRLESAPPQPQPQPPPADREAAPALRDPPAPGRRGGVIVPVLLAFLLGIALAALGFQHYGAKKDSEREAVVARARRALAEGHYVAPPEENVNDICGAGLKRWPDEARLTQIQSDAAHELVTSAIAKRSSGDVLQARKLVETALVLDPGEDSAKVLLDQYKDEIASAGDGGGTGAGVGLPKALTDIEESAKVGEKVDLVGKVTVGSKPATGRATEAKFTVTGPGLPTAGAVLNAGPSGAGTYKVATKLPREGKYVVVFEAIVDGVPVRAEDEILITEP
jgi:serine/threonine protein kinase